MDLEMDYPIDLSRTCHATAVVGDCVYLWGGLLQDQLHHKETSSPSINIYNTITSKWNMATTTSAGPFEVAPCKYSCIAVKTKIYYFGGWCHYNKTYYNNLNELDTVRLTWKVLSQTSNKRCVMRRGYGGMVRMGETNLLMVGGIGTPPTTRIPNAMYHQLPSMRFRTNEQNMYSLLTDEWMAVLFVGNCMPPTSSFIATNITDSKAIIYGGITNDGVISNDVYTVEYVDNTVHWTCVNTTGNGLYLPLGRYFHAASCISDELLLILGGKTSQHELANDCWIFNITTSAWLKIDLPTHLTQRCCHSVSCIPSGSISDSKCLLLLVGGGADEDVVIDDHYVSMAIELQLIDGEYRVINVCESYNYPSTNVSTSSPTYENTSMYKAEQRSLTISNLKQQLLDKDDEIAALKKRLDDSEDLQRQLLEQITPTPVAENPEIINPEIISRGPTTTKSNISDSFKKSIPELINAISGDIYRTTDRLYSESLIGTSVYNFVEIEALSSYIKARKIVYALENKLKLHQEPIHLLDYIIGAFRKLENADVVAILQSLK